MVRDIRRLYVGTKVLYAEPMTKAEYCAFRGWEVPENEDPDEGGFMVEYTDGGKPNMDGHEGYVSWSPADVFSKSYKPLDSQFFTFGEAVQRLKAGKPVARMGWNGKGMFLYYVPEGAYPARTQVAKATFGEDALVPYRPYIAMKTVDGDVVPWVASQSDILADDWLEGAN